VDDSLEESIFKTLSHQKRRDILRVIGESKEVTFTEIKESIGTEDSPSLSYHLNALNHLIMQKEGKYRLSELGRDAYSLVCKTTTYAASNSTISFLRREIPAVIIANAILWATAIFSVSQFEGRLHQITIFSFAALWFISNIILYSVSAKVRK
jgi:DNA-binding transcriptional ArsR family regulator